MDTTTNAVIDHNIIISSSNVPGGSCGISLNFNASSTTIDNNFITLNNYGMILSTTSRLTNNKVFGNSINFAGSTTTANPNGFGLIRQFGINFGNPSVLDGSVFSSSNTISTTINNLTNGVDGQQITIIFNDTNTVVDFSGSNIKGNGGFLYYPRFNDSMSCVYSSSASAWYCSTLGLPTVSSTTASATVGATNVVSVSTLTLNPGNYLLSATIYSNSGNSTTNDITACISPNSNSLSGCTNGYDKIFVLCNGSGHASGSIFGKSVQITSQTSFYVNTQWSAGSAASTIATTLIAIPTK